MAFYLLGYLLLYVSHTTEPTNLAGPGIDMIVLFILLIGILYLFIRTLIKKDILLFSKIFITAIHILGVSVIVWWANQPS